MRRRIAPDAPDRIASHPQDTKAGTRKAIIPLHNPRDPWNSAKGCCRFPTQPECADEDDTPF
jgi:hypothetical protein